MYTKLRTLSVPSFVWFALLVLAVGTIHTYAENAIYYDAVLLLLAGIAKALDIRFDKVIAVVEDELDTKIDIVDVESWMQPGVAARSSVRPPVEAATELVDVELSPTQYMRRWLVG